MSPTLAPRNQTLRLFAIVVALFVGLRLVYWFTSFPNPDEAYYWLWGKHPELSYFDHPPLHAWMQGLSGWLLGDTRFALRLTNLFTSLGLAYLFYLYLRRLVGPQAGAALVITLAVMFASPVMFGFTMTAWPDHTMLFTSSLAVYLFLRFFDSYLEDQRGRSRLLYLAAAALGLAALSKYNSVFVAVGILLTLTFNPRLRRLWRDPRLYLAALVTLVVMTPLLLWNLEHHFASFNYHLMQRTVIGSERTLSLTAGLGFLLVIAFTLSPFVLWMLYQGLRRRQQLTAQFPGLEHYLQLPLWIFVAATGTFTLLSLYSAMLYYWNIVAYPFLFPLLAVYLLRTQGQRWASWGHLVYGLGFALVMVFHTTVVPISAYVDETNDQDSRMLYGWDEVREHTRRQLQALGPDTVLMATGYRKASALAFALGHKDVVCISGRRDEFDYWQEGKEYGNRTALILYDDWHPINDELKAMYTSIKEVDRVEVRRSGRFIKHYYLAVGSNP